MSPNYQETHLQDILLHNALLQVFSNNTPNRLYVACSMGRDSLALLFACQSLYLSGQLPMPIALHIHHHLQDIADSWAVAFTTFCQTHNIAYHLLDVYPTKSDENCARQLRYLAMASVMQDQDILLTAHHANDQCETVLMRLINGTGITGLCGIGTKSQKQLADKNICVYRPWLNISRDTISDYVARHNLPYVDDPTNEFGSTRAKLRAVLPALHAINPSVIDNINRTAYIAQDFKSLSHDLMLGLKKQAIQYTSDYLTIINLNELSILKTATQRIFLHEFLAQNSPYPPNFALIAQVIDLIHKTDTDHATQIFWAGANVMIFRYQRCLFVLAKALFDFLKYKQDYALPSFVVVPCGVTLIKAIDNHSKISIGHKNLSGKKLYQHLKIPVIFRHTLFLCEYKGTPYIASIGISFALTPTTCQNLPCFGVDNLANLE